MTAQEVTMVQAATSVWLVPIAIVLMAYANIVLKLRILALGESSSVSWLPYLLSMLLDPWTWSALTAAMATGLLYVILLRQLELSVLQPLFALVFAVVPLAAMFILGEQLPPLRIAGLVLIVLGVVLVGQTA
jgi:drug/metabolite transporter (DMT)-like permease